MIVGPANEIKGKGVEYKGPVLPSDMPEIYRKASIFVLPTLREPFGLAFLEAMSFGLPCIGTDIEAIPEIIDNEKDGFIVPKFNANKLAGKIIGASAAYAEPR